jgi:hypothetical protein
MREAFSLLFLRSFDIRYEINETCHRGTLLFDTIAKKFIKIFIFIQDQQSERERKKERKKEKRRQGIIFHQSTLLHQPPSRSSYLAGMDTNTHAQTRTNTFILKFHLSSINPSHLSILLFTPLPFILSRSFFHSHTHSFSLSLSLSLRSLLSTYILSFFHLRVFIGDLELVSKESAKLTHKESFIHSIHSIRLCTIQVLSLQRKETETKTERKIKEHRR